METAAGTHLRVFAWSRAQGEWLEGEMPAGAGYREDDSIPILVHIERATPGTPYDMTIRYDCATDEGAAFDFLSSREATDGAAAHKEPGPGARFPDSTVDIPNDPAIDFDDRAEGQFQLWGATFKEFPRGPLPLDPCDRRKEFRLSLGAVGETVFLIFGAHGASSRDWGERGGAASAGGVSIETVIRGAAEARVTIAAGALLP
jgi:hypothetical protein